MKEQRLWTRVAHILILLLCMLDLPIEKSLSKVNVGGDTIQPSGSRPQYGLDIQMQGQRAALDGPTSVCTFRGSTRPATSTTRGPSSKVRATLWLGDAPGKLKTPLEHSKLCPV